MSLPPPSPQLTLKDFGYPLPASHIAQQPVSPRDHSRLLLLDRQGALHGHSFFDLVDLLPRNSLLLLNDSKVIPCRVWGKLATGGKVEILILDHFPSESGSYRALGRPSKKLVVGSQIFVTASAGFAIVGKRLSPHLTEIDVRPFGCEGPLAEWLTHNGSVPLPPYIRRGQAAREDTLSYQTVFSRAGGSCAAPTAGLHFTPELLQKLAARGVEIKSLTHHVGLGTFLPVKTPDPQNHKMHAESYSCPRATWEAIRAAKAAQRPIIACGTTTFRCVESLNMERASEGWQKTQMFVFPAHRADRYIPRLVTGLVTNFHQPESTLFMLICALVGTDRAFAVYEHALNNGYRFLSYGDACFFLL